MVQIAAPKPPAPGLQTAVVTAALHSATDRPSTAGAAALRYALAQLGKPYVWGATGPDTFDCSGLTSQAWAHAGITIPRTSQEQWAQLQHIPLSTLRPGDLIVYFAGATHVALYIGNGNVIQAPHPGAVIDIVPLDSNPVLGAVRPDPADPSVSAPVTPIPAKPTGHPPVNPPTTRPTTPAKPGKPKPPVPSPTPTPAPLAAPTVTSSQYPATGNGAPDGTAGLFSFSTAATGTTSFEYSLNLAFDAHGVQPTTVTASNGQATITLTPAQLATNTLYVRYATKDGRTSPAAYTFNVAAPTARLTALGDLTGDGLPDRVVLDTTGRLWLYPGQPGGALAASPKELSLPTTGTPVNWAAVSAISILASTGPSSPPCLEAVENAVTHRFTLNPDGTLVTETLTPPATTPAATPPPTAEAAVAPRQ